MQVIDGKVDDVRMCTSSEACSSLGSLQPLMTWATRLGGLEYSRTPGKLEVGVVRCVCKCILALCLYA